MRSSQLNDGRRAPAPRVTARVERAAALYERLLLAEGTPRATVLRRRIGSFLDVATPREQRAYYIAIALIRSAWQQPPKRSS